MKKKKRKNLKTQWSNLYILIVFFFIGGFVLFGTSKLYMAENIEVNQTELQREFDLRANGKFMIEDWKYDANNNKMEVILITNGIRNYNSELNFIAVSRNDLKTKLPVEIMLNDNDIYIIHINNVPKDFEQIALRLLKSEIGIDEIFNTEKQENDKDNDSIISTIYTDQRVVKQEAISNKNMSEYALEITDSMIEINKNKISDIKKQIAGIEKINEKIGKEIENLKSELIYQTVEEQVQTSNKIFTLETDIEQNNREVNILNQDINNLNAKVEKLTQRKRDLEI